MGIVTSSVQRRYSLTRLLSAKRYRSPSESLGNEKECRVPGNSYSCEHLGKAGVKPKQLVGLHIESRHDGGVHGVLRDVVKSGVKEAYLVSVIGQGFALIHQISAITINL